MGPGVGEVMLQEKSIFTDRQDILIKIWLGLRKKYHQTAYFLGMFLSNSSQKEGTFHFLYDFYVIFICL